MESIWPQRILDALGREPQVGDWFAECCIEDLQQLTAESLAEIRENYEDMDSGGNAWLTKEAALRDLAGEG